MFPLCRRPGSLAVLDDDPVFLTVFQTQLSTGWNATAFEHSEQLLAHLEMDQPFWEVDVWLQQELVAKWRSGACSLAIGVMDYWRRQTERFACTRVCLIDYRLQGRTGLDVLRNVGNWQGRRVLVTGASDAGLPERATSSGLIDGFFTKSGARLLPDLIALVDRFQEEPDPRLQRLWGETLSSEQRAALAGPGVEAAVRAMLGRHVVEYVVLADPFGILCLHADGAVSWMPLAMNCVGQTVSDAALRQALDLDGTLPQQAVAKAVGGAGLGGAFFSMHLHDELELPLGYGGWLVRQQAGRPYDIGRRAMAAADAGGVKSLGGAARQLERPGDRVRGGHSMDVPEMRACN